MIPADTVAEMVTTLFVPMMEVSSGQILSQTTPKMKVLAYEIVKSINNKNQKYKEAYFGAVKFQADPAFIENVKKLLDKNTDILRFLLLTIPKGADRTLPKRSLSRKPKTEASVKEEGEKGEPMSSEEIDKEIEGLIANTEI